MSVSDFGQYKVFGTQFTLHGGFQWWISRFLQGGAAYPFIVPVLPRIVLPHAAAIAFLVAYGELAIGLALVFGILRTDCQRVRADLLALSAVLFQLSGRSRCHLAVFSALPSIIQSWPCAFSTFMASRSDEVLSVKTRARKEKRS